MPSVARPWGCPCRPTARRPGTGRRGHRTQAEALGQSGADLAHRRQDGLVPLLPQPKGADKVAHPLDPGAPAHLQQQGDGLAGIPEVGPLGRGTDGQLVAAEVGLFMGGGAPQVAQQRRVVHVADLGFGGAHPPGQRGGDQAGADRLLRLLSHPQVGGHRHRGQKVGQPDPLREHALLASGQDRKHVSPPLETRSANR